MIRTLVVVVAALGLSAGCTKSEADLRQDDLRTLELIVAEDARASRAMSAVDEAARRGDTPAAIEAIETKAKPAIEAGRRVVANARPKTPWGQSSLNTFAKILDDRDSEVGPYAEALKSGAPEKLIDAIEAQAKIERRALDAVAAVREGR